MKEEIKNSAVDLTDLAISIVVLGVIVSIGGSILITYRDTRLTDLDTFATNNESTSITQTTDALTNTWGKSVGNCYGDVNQSGVPGDIANPPTGYELITPANYTATISNLDGTITLQNATSFQFPNATCVYTSYNTSRADWDVTDKAAAGLGEYGNWFKILVIVGVAAVVLSLIFMAFGNRGGQSGPGVSY